MEFSRCMVYRVSGLILTCPSSMSQGTQSLIDHGPAQCVWTRWKPVNGGDTSYWIISEPEFGARQSILNIPSINVLEALGIWSYLRSISWWRSSPNPSTRLTRSSSEGTTNQAGKGRRSHGLMRILGLLEIRERWKFEAEHVPGILNRAADGISLEPRIGASYPYLHFPDNISSQELPFQSKGRSIGSWTPTRSTRRCEVV